MKQILAISLLITLMLGCKSKTNPVCIISGKASNYDAEEMSLTINGQKDTIRINEDGTFTKKLSFRYPVDGYLYVKRFLINVYLEPGKNLEIKFDAKDIEKSMEFEGDMSLPARYLHEKTLIAKKSRKRIREIWMHPNFSEYKSVNGSLSKEEYAFLEKFEADHPALSRQFYKREKKAIEFNLYSELYRFPNFKTDLKVPADWYDFMDKIDIQDPSFLEIRSVRWFFIYHVAYESMKRINISPDESRGNSKYIKETFSFVKEKFAHPKFYDVLIHHFLSQYMENDRKGPAGIEDLVDEYLANCTTEEYRMHIQDLKNKWNPVAGGQPAPIFTLPDNKGNYVSLSDFKGKYVFIDFWYTSCGPCKTDFPYLKQLIDDLKNRNIVFISLSVDKEKSAWEKMLREGYIEDEKLVLFEEKSNWIHLHDPKTREVYKKYLVTSFPTYSLIDPDGKFVNARCPRPKWPNQLRPILDAQPGL